jgi:hypothetical protein
MFRTISTHKSEASRRTVGQTDWYYFIVKYSYAFCAKNACYARKWTVMKFLFPTAFYNEIVADNKITLTTHFFSLGFIMCLYL